MDDKDNPLGFEQLIQNVNNIAQILSRLTADLEDGGGLLFQPLNSLLTSISALSATLTTNNLIMGSGLGTVAAKTLSEVIDANASNAQGDILYRGAALWGVLAPGTAGQFLKTQGAAANVIWANAFVKVALQVVTATGAFTYSPTTGMMFTLLGTVGGGAGGGGCANSGAGTVDQGGGGGGGSTSLALKTAAQVGASQAGSVGASAAGGTAGNNNGTAGNDTNIGTLCVGKGGSAGGGAAAGGVGTAGAGGVAGTGDITVPGQAGATGLNATIITVNAVLGNGGSSGLGFGAGGPGTLGAATNGGNYGGGGSGARSIAADGAKAGGIGAQGIAFALDFCGV